MSAAEKPTGLALLRVPFDANQVSKLPKQQKRDDQDKGKCVQGSRYSADGFYCGGWHARSIHLDYVGHAALTDRLLDADPDWSWEPAYHDVDPQVLAAACASGDAEIVRMVIANAPPLLDRDGGMWLRLTVCGTSRLGYGDSAGKGGANGTKERIGDGLRNAGMRFGAALDLWHKGDLHVEDTEPAGDAAPAEPPAAREVDVSLEAARADLKSVMDERGMGWSEVAVLFAKRYGPGNVVGNADAATVAEFAGLLRTGEAA